MFFIYLSNTSTLSNVKYSIIKGKYLDILYKSLKEMPRRGFKKKLMTVLWLQMSVENI